MKELNQANYPIRKNIRQFRKEAGYTQNELAAFFSSKKGFISNFENGYSTPDIYILIRMADIFKVSLDELVGRDFR